LILEDACRDYGERRLIALGEYDGAVIRVVFTERGRRHSHHLGMAGQHR
jgi:uncharacterized DUF497 family protein